jgi:hypothetical protein
MRSGAKGSGYYTNVKALLGASGNDTVDGAGAVPNAMVHHTGSCVHYEGAGLPLSLVPFAFI